MRLARAKRVTRSPASATRLLDAAGEEAVRLGHEAVVAEHLLVACVRLGEGSLDELDLGLDELLAEVVERAHVPRRIDGEALASIGIDLDEVRARIEERFGPGALQRTRAVSGCGMSVSPSVKKALELARDEAEQLGQTVGPELALIGILREARTAAASILLRRGVSESQLRALAVRRAEQGR